MKIVQVIETVVIILIVLAGLFLALPVGAKVIDRLERTECLKLQHQANTIASDVFYITETEEEMCVSHDIEVPARVLQADGTFRIKGGVYDATPLTTI